ncbi:DNA repair protein XRCC4 isoform X2 [Thalassophryne amazonica]|uniref:DNA repair protein XRCC4 isoform X2 n=1 Tax=Thalassophryne amazonica TaxID=390379 RepID=UPI00147249E7|nr:DNA repair protein XRCC4 isoform X2 [Thalassophryne amazonica]
MDMSVREIHVMSEPQSSYFLRVDWKGRDLGSGFQLLLTDGQDAWRGDVSEAAVSAEAEELEMEKEKYIQDLQQVLTGTEASTSYSFSLTPSPPVQNSAVTLAYEKVQKDISFRLGSVLLNADPGPAEVVRELLIHSLQRGNKLQRHNQKLEEQYQKLRQEQERIIAELKDYAGVKEALEAELFSRFVLVLNEKKAKIRSLQNTISHLQEARTSGGQKKGDSKKSVQITHQEETADEDEYGCSTDEEPEGVKSSSDMTLPSQESLTPKPFDVSLSDIIDVAPSRKRRVRHVEAPDTKVKHSNPKTSPRRSHGPAGSNNQEVPQCSTHATTAADDLFEDF